MTVDQHKTTEVKTLLKDMIKGTYGTTTEFRTYATVMEQYRTILEDLEIIAKEQQRYNDMIEEALDGTVK